MPNQLDIFVSSTCYDLGDLRAELRAFLEQHGYPVRLSDDFDSGFEADPAKDSIASCLLNVERCDAVVCVVDRRYGPPLPHGEYAGKSATHAEIIYARKLGRPVFPFIRDRALVAYGQLDDDVTNIPKGVDLKHVRHWRDFIAYLTKLPADGGPNWYDQFANVVELKPRVHKRLLDQFPHQRAHAALHPDRLVRLYRCGAEYGDWGSGVSFGNAGVGPAINLRVGMLLGDGCEFRRCIETQGALAEKDVFREGPYVPESKEIKGVDVTKIFCDYENRFGDRYRVVTPIKIRHDFLPFRNGADEFYIGHLTSEGVEWIRVT